jgi:hypothetical protein
MPRGRTETTSLKRSAQPALVALLVGMLVALGAFAPVTAAARVPKVALIVGPVGDTITARYKALANEAASVARNAGAEVVKVYSPNATWPAVRNAIRGASIVIYLGHGNGWPSRYRSELFPPSQNGFGLNPVAGGDNSAHQYFGEASVDNVKLAKNAIVLLHHLCYASGNTEPGLPEGTRDQAIQRVDNYAAGFIRAGAAAVVAEGHMGPAWYVRQLLTGKGSIESIWNRSPNANGNTFKVPSVRSKGFVSRLDPYNRSSGFYRSLVSRGGTTANDVKSGALGTVSNAIAGPPPVPTLANAALKFGTLTLNTLPIAATSTEVTIPVSGGNASTIPAGAQVGLRWDPILLDAPPTPEPTPEPSVRPDPSASPDPAASASPGGSPDPLAQPSPSGSPDPAASAAASTSPSPSSSVSPSTAAPSASPSASPSPSPSPSPSASPSPTASPAPTEKPSPTWAPPKGMFTLPSQQPAFEPDPTDAPASEESTGVVIPTEAPAVDLVVPERTGSVVVTTKATRGPGGIEVAVTYPTEPGLYRLVPTLHTPSGVAYDAATQAMLTPVLVRIGGEIAVAYGAPTNLILNAGMEASIPVRVLNSGSQAWDLSVTLGPGEGGDDPTSGYHTSRFPAILTGTWVSTTSAPVPAAASTELDATIAGPGGSVAVALDVTAPDSPGEYLLLLDTISPTSGPLSALGSAPALVRVTVTEAPPDLTPVPPQLGR